MISLKSEWGTGAKFGGGVKVAASLARWSAWSFPSIPTCPGIQTKMISLSGRREFISSINDKMIILLVLKLFSAFSTDRESEKIRKDVSEDF